MTLAGSYSLNLLLKSCLEQIRPRRASFRLKISEWLKVLGAVSMVSGASVPPLTNKNHCTPADVIEVSNKLMESFNSVILDRGTMAIFFKTNGAPWDFFFASCDVGLNCNYNQAGNHAVYIHYVCPSCIVFMLSAIK